MSDTVTMPDADAIAAMTPADADAKLTELKGSAGFRERFLQGAPAEAKALSALMERRGADFRLDSIVAGTAETPLIETHLGNELTTHNAMLAAGGLRDLGVPDPVIKQAFQGEGVSQAEFDAAAKVKADLMTNKEFVTKYLANDREAVRQMTLLNIIAVAGPRKAAA